MNPPRIVNLTGQDKAVRQIANLDRGIRSHVVYALWKRKRHGIRVPVVTEVLTQAKGNVFLVPGFAGGRRLAGCELSSRIGAGRAGTAKSMTRRNIEGNDALAAFDLLL